MTKEKEFRIALGIVLKQRRRALCLTQYDLAYISKFQRTYICDVERGIRNISLTNLHKITTALGCSLYQVIREVEEE